MRAIQYAAPASLKEAVALLGQHGARARVLAGGTDLIVQVREYNRDLDVIVDGKHVPELMELSFDPRKGLTLGAAVPCYRIYHDPQVVEHYPGLIDAVSMIGGTAIQGRASVGGNLCNSGPAADTIPPLIVYSATARIAGPDGERAVPVEEFCTGPGRNVLRNDEMLVSLHLPPPPAHFGARYLRFIPRNEMDIAEVGAGASVQLDPAGNTILAARIALGAVAPTPLLVAEAGEALAGKAVSDAAIEEAAALAQAAARPISDMRGTVEHRRHLVGVLTRRALRGAIDRARGIGDERPAANGERRRASPTPSANGYFRTPGGPGRVPVQATVNGEPVDFLCEPRESLLEVLRDRLGLTGSKEGCNNGNCGACSVLMDGRLVNSCCVLGVEAQGTQVTTIEGIGSPQGLTPLQQAFLEGAALQCGVCTPGFIVAAHALLQENPNPTEGEIRLWLAGNLCRCTGYDKIVRAVQTAASKGRS